MRDCSSYTRLGDSPNNRSDRSNARAHGLMLYEAAAVARIFGHDGFRPNPELDAPRRETRRPSQTRLTRTTKLPHPKMFLKELLRYGFCITPRMWKKEEIVCICISLLDPRLNCTGIRHKDGVDSQQSFRGMAGLDSRVQQFFYRRLCAYGFVNPRWHPEKLQSFSSVVINGGGSWKQSSDWTFNH